MLATKTSAAEIPRCSGSLTGMPGTMTHISQHDRCCFLRNATVQGRYRGPFHHITLPELPRRSCLREASRNDRRFGRGERVTAFFYWGVSDIMLPSKRESGNIYEGQSVLISVSREGVGYQVTGHYLILSGTEPHVIKGSRAALYQEPRACHDVVCRVRKSLCVIQPGMLPVPRSKMNQKPSVDEVGPIRDIKTDVALRESFSGQSHGFGADKGRQRLCVPTAAQKASMPHRPPGHVLRCARRQRNSILIVSRMSCPSLFRPSVIPFAYSSLSHMGATKERPTALTAATVDKIYIK